MGPVRGHLRGLVTLPVSKSLANRRAILHALAGHPIDLPPGGVPDDVLVMHRALTAQTDMIDIDMAGTAARFVLAACAATGRSVVLDGAARMRERPMAALIDALRSLGADIRCLGADGHLPVRIGRGAMRGGTVHIAADVSSQFTSALLMIGSVLVDGLRIETTGRTVSRPYIDMTVTLMRRAGIAVERDADGWTVPHGRAEPFTAPIEADWSAAAFFYALLARADGGDLFLRGLRADSLQGDAAVAGIFHDLFGIQTFFEHDGARIIRSERLRPERVDLDLNDHPDLAQALVLLCASLQIPCQIEGLATLRHKETDRIDALRMAAEQMGCVVETTDGSISIHQAQHTPARHGYRVFGDHRMAMALAAAGVAADGMDAPEVVTKSFPGFWTELEHIIR